MVSLDEMGGAFTASAQPSLGSCRHGNAATDSCGKRPRKQTLLFCFFHGEKEGISKKHSSASVCQFSIHDRFKGLRTRQKCVCMCVGWVCVCGGWS